MKWLNNFSFILIYFFLISDVNATSYNSHGQTGLINLPSAEVHEQQSVFFTFNKNVYSKIGTLTVTPFDWMEASYFYYRPDDLLWGNTKGLYLDKGFNIKFSYKPKTHFLPTFAIGLEDFAGTGQFSREFIASTYELNKIKLTTGIGWGKYVGDSSISNPLKFFSDRLEVRELISDNSSLGGNLSYDLWFRGDAIFFGGIEARLGNLKNLSLKVESNPFNYFKYGCCGEGLSEESFEVRKNESDINFGISYKYKDFGNIDLSYTKGNTWNLVFSIGFSAKKPLRKKNKFEPKIENKSYNQNQKNEFYLDLLNNLNSNRLFLQSASIKDDQLSLTIDSSEHINPIIYSSRAAYIANEVSMLNDLSLSKIEVGHINRGAQINKIAYQTSDLDLYERYPDILIKRNSIVSNVNKDNFREHDFVPKVNFPVFFNSIEPDVRTHIGSPEKFLFSGIGIKAVTEIQINRNIVINSSIGRSIEDNFDEKVSRPSSTLPLVRTEIVDYLQGSSDDFYITNLDIETIWSPFNNTWAKFNIGYLEMMYGGYSGEIMYKPFKYNFALSLEHNSVKKRKYDQKFSFLEYKIATSHLNIAYYESNTNILAKWSYGKYLAGDTGYTLDLSRRMPSGWRAGFFFTRTNVSAEDFGEGSFDKGFYFNIPFNVFSKGYSKNSNGFQLKTMTRDGGQKLELRNKLIDSFYGSSYSEINENWNNYLD